MRFTRLAIYSVVAANIGYTIFLFPLLSALYRDLVPFTVANALYFLAIDSVGGIIVAAITFAIAKAFRTSVARSSAIAIATLWILYWLAIGSTGRGDITVVLLDGIAATITWITLVTIHQALHKLDKRP